MSKKQIRIFSLLAFLLLMGIFIWFQWFRSPEGTKGKEIATPGAGASPSAPLEVRAHRVVAEKLQDAIQVNGSIQPSEEVIISTEIAGRLQDIQFKEGTRVASGTKLVKLNDEELQAQRKKLVVQKELAQRIADRLQLLFEQEGVSQQEYEVARAEVNTIQADIDLLDAQLEKTSVRAPFSGRLGLRMVSEGAYLSPGMAIVNLVRTDPLELVFSVPERYGNRLKKGDQVSFQLSEFGDEEFNATIVAINPVIEAETRTLTMKARTSNPNDRILPGSYARVTLNLSEFEEALLVPAESVVSELGGKRVFLYREGKTVPQDIRTGIRTKSMIQIVEGLNEGDTVITTGILQLRPQMPVTLTEIN